MKRLPLVIALTLFPSSVFAQQQSAKPLNDQRVVDLVAMGVSEQEILRMIASAPKFDFDLRPESTEALLKLGVSEEVIKGMAAKELKPFVQTTAVQVPVKPPETNGLRRTLAAAVGAENKPRVYVGQANDSWSFTATRNFAQGGTHPQTVEVMKTFGESCPNLVVTSNPDKADYKVLFERESNKGLRKHNKFAAFNQNGDMVYSASTRNLGNSVRGFCAVIESH
jgi:hypothetical protein